MGNTFSTGAPAVRQGVDTSYVSYAKAAAPTFAIALGVFGFYDWLSSVRSLTKEEIAAYDAFGLQMPVTGYPLFSVFIAELARYRDLAPNEVEAAAHALDALFYLESYDRSRLKSMHADQALVHLNAVLESLRGIEAKLETQTGTEFTGADRRRWMQVHDDGKEIAQRAFNNVLIAVRDERTYLTY